MTVVFGIKILAGKRESWSFVYGCRSLNDVARVWFGNDVSITWWVSEQHVTGAWWKSTRMADLVWGMGCWRYVARKCCDRIGKFSAGGWVPEIFPLSRIMNKIQHFGRWTQGQTPAVLGLLQSWSMGKFSQPTTSLFQFAVHSVVFTVFIININPSMMLGFKLLLLPRTDEFWIHTTLKRIHDYLVHQGQQLRVYVIKTSPYVLTQSNSVEQLVLCNSLNWADVSVLFLSVKLEDGENAETKWNVPSEPFRKTGLCTSNCRCLWLQHLTKTGSHMWPTGRVGMTVHDL
jgi:hypothetical protein